jgi:penicillin amidase
MPIMKSTRFLKIALFFILLTFSFLSVGIAYIFFPTSHQSGKLYLNGLRGKVKIYRDNNGVPHIVAMNSDDDAFFALGFIHAQDRS